MKMNKSYGLVGIFSILLLSLLLVNIIPSISSGSDVINTFLNYEDSPEASSKTVTQGDSFNLVLVAYGHGEQLSYEQLELVSSTLIFKEYVSGDQILDYTYLYSKTYSLNTGILNPGTYTLRFSARTKVTNSEEYSDLQLIILPKVIPPVCGNSKIETGEECDNGLLNGQPCNPLYGSSCTYCSASCKSITINGPSCGDGQCNGNENCSTCSTDCGICPDNIKPVVNITNPLATTYSSHRTNLVFNVYDDNLDSCTYRLNGALPINVPSASNGQNTVSGIISALGTNTWSVTCKDKSGNTGTDSVTFTIVIPPRCGDGQCNGNENCSTCSTDCGICPDNIKPVVNITNPLATDYCSQRTILVFSVYDDNLKSCTYKLNGDVQVNVVSLINGVNTITGISSNTGVNTWSVTCKDNSDNVGSDSVTFRVNEKKENCTVCKDSKPLEYDSSYIESLNKKITVVAEEDMPVLSLNSYESKKSVLANKYSLFSFILIIGVLVMLILIIILRLIRR
jgi:hypothetical protein